MRLENGQIIAEVTAFGAELQMLARVGGKNCLWQVDERYWNRISPLLFPIVGKLRGDWAESPSGKIQLRQHGFARDSDFVIRYQSSDCLILTLADDARTRQAYPFSFELEVEYRLEAERLMVRYSVCNSGESDMPFSIGAHPGFALNGPLEEHRLVFSEPLWTQRYWIENGLYTGTSSPCLNGESELPLKSEDFQQDAIVFKHSGISSVRLEHRDGPIVEMQLPSADDFPYWGFWTKPAAPFFCLEPWAGLADSVDGSGEFLEKEGILLLKPGDRKSFGYTLKPF
jgi:galactose mutarotase-like enzyme